MPATDQTAYSSNPFRRKAAASQGLENDTSKHPSSPAPSSPYSSTSTSFGRDARTTLSDHRSDLSLEYNGTPQSAIPRQPFTTFRSSSSDHDSSGPGEDSLQARPKKIVKKVRVQSPPPPTPEDVVPVTKDESDDYSYDDDDHDHDDAQNDGFTDNRGRVNPFGAHESPTQVGPQLIKAVPPANPFARTLQDIEPAAQNGDGATGAVGTPRGAMDVNSFKRLLLTGQSDRSASTEDAVVTADSQSAGATGARDAAYNTDTSPVSRQSLVDRAQNTSLTSRDTSESDKIEKSSRGVPASRLAASSRSGTSRPKPPPPSSRHGKLIKVELGSEDSNTAARGSADQSGSSTSQPQAIDSDVNKPLPLTPTRTIADEASESPFDREAAGKTPEAFLDEPRPHISPAASIARPRSDSQGSTQSKRAAAPPQAPPPRRHARSESKTVSSQSKSNDEDPPRSSLDSTRSRSESLRAGNLPVAPAPPPRRRPNHGRSASSYSISAQPDATNAPKMSQRLRTPSLEEQMSMDETGGSPQAGLSRESTSKVAAPPPPPARNASLRRPAIQRGPEASTPSAIGRKSSGNRNSFAAPPPPPPPRQRGSSRGSMEINTRPALKDLSSQSSIEKDSNQASTTAPAESLGKDILADLDALQREVDALMQQAKG